MPPEREGRNWGFIAAIVGCVVFWILAAWGVRELLFSTAAHAEPRAYCISTIGPVDQEGRGDTTPEVTGSSCP